MYLITVLRAPSLPDRYDLYDLQGHIRTCLQRHDRSSHGPINGVPSVVYAGAQAITAGNYHRMVLDTSGTGYAGQLVSSAMGRKTLRVILWMCYQVSETPLEYWSRHQRSCPPHAFKPFALPIKPLCNRDSQPSPSAQASSLTHTCARSHDHSYQRIHAHDQCAYAQKHPHALTHSPSLWI